MRLLSNRCFTSRDDLSAYIALYNGDHEAAYEDWIVTDPDAPPTCKDDFRDLFMEDEGEEVGNAEQPALHGDFSMFQVDPKFDEVRSNVDKQNFDWISATQQQYSDAEIRDAARWSERAFADFKLSRHSPSTRRR